LTKKNPIVRKYLIQTNAYLRSLTVANGVSGVVDFSIIKGSARIIWIDDLYVNPGAFLIVKNMPSDSQFMINFGNNTGDRFFNRIDLPIKLWFCESEGTGIRLRLELRSGLLSTLGTSTRSRTFDLWSNLGCDGARTVGLAEAGALPLGFAA